MNTETLAVTAFVENWTVAFGQAVEKHGGQPLEARLTEIGEVPPADMGPPLWVKHSFSGAGRFALWVGAPDSSWRGLGAASGEREGAALQSTYLAMLADAQQALTVSWSDGSEAALACDEPETFDSPGFETAGCKLFSIVLENAGVPALTVAVELAGLDFLDALWRKRQAVERTAESADGNPQRSWERLLTLKLPVSISLGGSTLELKKVLEAERGSVIALNKETCEPVELLVQGNVVARGEIVSVKGNYGIRIRQVIDREERIRMCTSV